MDTRSCRIRPLSNCTSINGLNDVCFSKTMPKPPQSQGMQAQIAQQMMVVFPPMITIVFLFMPAGVVVYSVVNMLLQLFLRY